MVFMTRQMLLFLWDLQTLATQPLLSMTGTGSTTKSSVLRSLLQSFWGSENKKDVDGVGGIFLAQGGFLIIPFSRSDPIHTPFQSSLSITFQKAPLDCNATYFELIPWWGGTLKRETKKGGWWRIRENFQAASSSWRIICTRGDDRIISTRCEYSRNCTHTDYWLYSPEVTERPPTFCLKYFQNRGLRLGLIEIFSKHDRNIFKTR